MVEEVHNYTANGKLFYLPLNTIINTCFQLQFCIAFLHSIQLLFYDCGYPRWTLVITAPNAIFFYYLFSDFYNKAYKNDRKSECKKLD